MNITFAVANCGFRSPFADSQQLNFTIPIFWASTSDEFDAGPAHYQTSKDDLAPELNKKSSMFVSGVKRLHEPPAIQTVSTQTMHQ